jgi:hypothetical protein
MALRGRVGRHTQQGGRQCQNWSDDQQQVIDLLNKISVQNGGAYGWLKPRIIGGIASNELYAAIVTFENKQYPGQNSGYIDPGGPMYRKLVLLSATPAAAGPPPASTAAKPSAEEPDGPGTSTEPRMLKEAEKAILRPVFGNTLPYDDQQVAANTREWGGSNNSITPNYLPLFALSIWRFDFSRASPEDKWIFVHEMTHAWQWYHGHNNVTAAICLFTKYGSDYDPGAYYYNFDDGASLFDFNFEQQASIVADYWYVTQGKTPKYVKGMRANRATYEQYMAQIWGGGPPQRGPYRDKSQDWKMQRHTP